MSHLLRSWEPVPAAAETPVAESDRAGLAHFCAGFSRFLHTHHDGEEEVIFPKQTEVAARAGLPEVRAQPVDRAVAE
jgi:hypothetical protein